MASTLGYLVEDHQAVLYVVLVLECQSCSSIMLISLFHISLYSVVS